MRGDHDRVPTVTKEVHQKVPDDSVVVHDQDADGQNVMSARSLIRPNSTSMCRGMRRIAGR
jgi:hypothetical protein